MKYTVWILCCLSMGTLLSQVPGYRGKKVLVKANVKCMPLTGYFISNEGFLDLNPRFSIGTDVVLSKILTLGVSVEQVNDIVSLEKYTLGSAYEFPRAYYTSANFYGFNYGCNLKMFTHKTSGSIAPFGRYFVMEYLYNDMEVTDNGAFYPSGKKELNDFKAHTFIIGLGSQKVYFNRITLEMNIKAGLNTYGLKSFGKKVPQFNQDEVYRVSTSKMFSDFLFTAGIGIGFLAF